MHRFNASKKVEKPCHRSREGLIDSFQEGKNDDDDDDDDERQKRGENERF